MTPSTPHANRVFYLDVVRAYAIFLVVVSHVFAPICWDMNSYSRAVWWVFNLADSVMRPCVPLFIMISGKLHLGSPHEEPYGRFVWKRYAKLVPSFFVWFMIYAYYASRTQGSPFSPAHAVLQFLQGEDSGHLYFMYIILALYLIAPILRAFVRTSKESDLAAVLVLWMVFLTVQFLFPEYAGSGPGVTLIDYGGYFLLGYFLDKTPGLRGKIGWLVSVSVAIVLFNACATYVLAVRQGNELNEKFYFGAAPLVAVYAAAAYLFLKNLNYEALLARWSWVRPAVTRVSLESYNIYLNHLLLLGILTNGYLGFTLSHDTGGSPLIGVPLTTAVVMAGSLGLAILLKKLPYVSRLFVIP